MMTLDDDNAEEETRSDAERAIDQSPEPVKDEEPEYPHGIKLALILLTTLLSIFLVALVAIPCSKK